MHSHQHSKVSARWAERALRIPAEPQGWAGLEMWLSNNLHLSILSLSCVCSALARAQRPDGTPNTPCSGAGGLPAGAPHGMCPPRSDVCHPVGHVPWLP